MAVGKMQHWFEVWVPEWRSDASAGTFDTLEEAQEEADRLSATRRVKIFEHFKQEQANGWSRVKCVTVCDLLPLSATEVTP